MPLIRFDPETITDDAIKVSEWVLRYFRPEYEKNKNDTTASWPKIARDCWEISAPETRACIWIQEGKLLKAQNAQKDADEKWGFLGLSSSRLFDPMLNKLQKDREDLTYAKEALAYIHKLAIEAALDPSTGALNVHEKDGQGRDLAYWILACLAPYSEFERLFEAGYLLNESSYFDCKMKAIHLAAKLGHLEALDALLKRDPGSLNAPDAYGQTPLIWAAAEGRLRTVKYLSEKRGLLLDARITLKSPYLNFTALHFATEQDHSSVALALMEAGADPLLLAGGGDTVLHRAIRLANEEVAKAIVQRAMLKGCLTDLIKMRNGAGMTALDVLLSKDSPRTKGLPTSKFIALQALADGTYDPGSAGTLQVGALNFGIAPAGLAPSAGYGAPPAGLGAPSAGCGVPLREAPSSLSTIFTSPAQAGPKDDITSQLSGLFGIDIKCKLVTHIPTHHILMFPESSNESVKHYAEILLEAGLKLCFRASNTCEHFRTPARIELSGELSEIQARLATSASRKVVVAGPKSR